MHKPKTKLNKNQKKPPKHQNIIEKLVSRILIYENQPQPKRADFHLQLIFKECFVLSSARKGLLGDTKDLAVSGDMSALKVVIVISLIAQTLIMDALFILNPIGIRVYLPLHRAALSSGSCVREDYNLENNKVCSIIIRYELFLKTCFKLPG